MNYPEPGNLAVLIGTEVKRCNLMTWARWFEAASHTRGPNGPSLRHVGHDTINDVCISTVFLGIDHGFGGDAQWFETMVFGGALHELMHRYETYAQAQAGHAFVVALVRGEDRRARDAVKAELERIAQK